jgi:endonuclease-3
MTIPAIRAKRHTCKRLLEVLRSSYGDRVWSGDRGAVAVLVATILSQNTSAANSSAGFRRLRRRFRSWSKLAEAGVAEIAECIRVSGLARTKAPRIRAILRRIRAEHGRITLAPLRRWPLAKARAYLEGFDGVGPKTALCVLLFAFGMPVFPVDTHIHRIARRLGLLEDGVGPAKADEVLTPLIAPDDRYAMHVLLIAHGRAVCRARRPGCEVCRALPLCPTGREKIRRR